MHNFWKEESTSGKGGSAVIFKVLPEIYVMLKLKLVWLMNLHVEVVCLIYNVNVKSKIDCFLPVFSLTS